SHAMERLSALALENDSGDVAVRLIAVGLRPYQAVIADLAPDHHWPLNNSYDDVINGNNMTVSPVNGGGAFITDVISEDTTHCWLAGNSRRESPNSNLMNGATTTNRFMGGWINLRTVQAGFACLYEEGGGINNLAFFTGQGNVLIAQMADTGDDNVQAFSDFKLSANRPYHVGFRFSYTELTKEFRLYIDGKLQSVTSGNPLTATDLDAHSGDVSWGGPGGSLEVAGTDVLFNLNEDCLFSNWVTWSTSLDESDIQELFERGAIPDVIISSDTGANMQASLDAIANTLRPDAPIAIRIEAPSDGSDLSLDADNVTFDERVTLHVEWQGVGQLNWTNLNGSNFDSAKGAATAGGTFNVINPALLSLTGLVDGTEVRVYEAGTQNEIGGVESSVGGNFAVSVQVNAVDIVIHSLTELNQRLSAVDTSSGDITLPIQQRIDRQYLNP
ncbi:MAG: hypothetical protein AAGC81_01940, partial [Pseudomonadota bacterium]